MAYLKILRQKKNNENSSTSKRQHKSLHLHLGVDGYILPQFIHVKRQRAILLTTQKESLNKKAQQGTPAP